MAGFKALQLLEDKYTDAEAVAAVAAADDYVKNTGDTLEGNLNVAAGAIINIPNGIEGVLFPQATHGEGMIKNSDGDGRMDIGFGAADGGNMTFYQKDYDAESGRKGRFAFVYGGSTTTGDIVFTHYNGTNWVQTVSYLQRDEMKLSMNLNMNTNIIKNPKNHVNSALSGTQKLVEIDIGGTSYYFKVYPTKA
jgi:hypothetical protein